MSPTLSNRLSTRLSTSLLALLFAFLAFVGPAAAAVDVNSADQSQLESVKGIGPSLSAKILAARKTGAFKDWADLQGRVSGIGEKNSVSFSRNGLTVSGRGKDGADSAVAGPRGGRPAAKKAAAEAGTVSGATTVASSLKK